MTATPSALTTPLTNAQIADATDEDGYVNTVVEVGLDDLIDNDLEGVLDLLSEKVIESGLLSDISYSAVGAQTHSVFIAVSGKPEIM